MLCSPFSILFEYLNNCVCYIGHCSISLLELAPHVRSVPGQHTMHAKRNLGKPSAFPYAKQEETNNLELENLESNHEKTNMSSPSASDGPAPPSNRKFNRFSKRGVSPSIADLDLSVLTSREASQWNLHPT